MVRVDTKKADVLYAKLKKMPAVIGIYALSGEYDALVVLQSDNTAKLDDALDEVGQLDGVVRTQTSIVLKVKYER